MVNKPVTEPPEPVADEGGEQNTGAEPDALAQPAADAPEVAEESGGQTTENKPDASAKGAKKKAPPKKRKKKSTKQLLIGFLIKVAAVVLAVWLLFTFVLGITIHYGNNMHPALRDGDLIISLRLQRPFLNAAVLYEHDGKTCLGRVVGMPGNVVDISPEGALTVNGVAPAEEVFYPTVRSESSPVAYPYTVGEEQVFILNDFRSDTNDSRFFGAVDIKDVKGPILIMLRRRGF